MAKAGKSGVIEQSPNAQTIKFAGKHINLSAIARAQGLDVSYLSRIFRGQRVPSLGHALKIAAILGMTVDDLVSGLQDRAEELKREHAAILQIHDTRIDKEVRKDLSLIKQGRAPIPRMPLQKIG
jgi:transcriptional regulator with XRE-family HTH domain